MPNDKPTDIEFKCYRCGKKFRVGRSKGLAEFQLNRHMKKCDGSIPTHKAQEEKEEPTEEQRVEKPPMEEPVKVEEPEIPIMEDEHENPDIF